MVLPPLGIAVGDSWSDTEIIMFLAERKTWDPLPQNILVGVDLTMIDPRDSPGTLWFLNWPDNQLCYDDENNVFRKAKNGYWKCVDACRIQTGTSILGVKLCLEFHEGQTPCGTRSGLMMYEYLIEQNDELNLPQAYKSLCRMFLQEDRKIVEDEHISLNLGVHHNFLGSYSQYLAEIQRQNMVMNSQTKKVSSSENWMNEKARNGQAQGSTDKRFLIFGVYVTDHLFDNQLKLLNIITRLNNYLELMIEEPRFSSIAYVRLDSQVKKLDKEYTSAMDLSSSLHQMLQKLNLRVQDEEVWVSQLGSNLQASFRKIMDTSSEIGKLEDEVLQLKVDIAEFAPGEVTSCAVYEMIKTLQIVELFMNNSTRHLKLIDGINSEMREFGSIFNGKVRCLVRFARYQQTIMEKSTQIINFLGDIRAKVDKMTQMYGLSEVVPIDSNQFIEGSFNADAYGTCSYYATLSSVESLYKREYASYPTILKDKIGQPDEFLVNLSRAQLEDIVEDFYTRHKVKGSKRLNVCLDKMKNEGVISEESYMNPQAQMRMKEHIFLTKIKKVIESHIMDGKVLIASFRITTGCYLIKSTKFQKKIPNMN
uniref:NAC domain-containing protein n=2 Tax=Oryza glumipatula TaxID=40148 RepID=A0A0E0B9Q0_9ORYZ